MNLLLLSNLATSHKGKNQVKARIILKINMPKYIFYIIKIRLVCNNLLGLLNAPTNAMLPQYASLIPVQQVFLSAVM